MFIYSVISVIIAFINIFCFFGNAIVYKNVNFSMPDISMFKLMFGGTIEIEMLGTKTVMPIEHSPGMLVLFILQLLIMFVAIAVLFFNVLNRREDLGAFLCVIMGIMCLLASLISFFTLQIYGYDTENSSLILELGVGPIIYSIFNLIIVILLVIHFRNVIYEKFVKKYAPTQLSSKIAYASKQTFTQAKPTLSEDEKANLILKYKKMLDEGVINLEEFAKKKKELL